MPMCSHRQLGILLAGVVAMSADVAMGATVIDATYRCDSGRQVAVRYDNTKADAATARLTMDGKTFDLYQVRSGSGARYATERGLKPDTGLQWWIKGNEATLSEMILDHTAPGPKSIDRCKVKTAS
jgi:membrane-bound inhibitor of C-type lysozyme